MGERGHEAAMPENGARPDTQSPTLCSPEERQRVLDRLVSALDTDTRIAGVVVVGSGAVGFQDAYSDIDLSVVLAEEEDVLPAFREWRERIEGLLPVIHCFEAAFGPSNYLWGFLLHGYLEVDVGFLCLDNLSARRGRWRVAFDRSGKIEHILGSSWESRPQPDLQSAYVRRADSIWHYIIHVTIALRRHQPWKALHYLEEIRGRSVELAALRRGLEAEHFREVDRLPQGLLAELARTLVPSPDAGEIKRALEAAAACFFREARELDRMLGLSVAGMLEPKMRAFLELGL